MKDLLPELMMNKPAASQMTAAAATNSAAQSSQTALFGGLMTDSDATRRSFVDSLLSSLQSIGAQDDVATNSAKGGNSLPLAPAAADLSPLPVMPDSMATQQDMTIVPGLPSATLVTAPQEGTLTSPASSLAARSGAMSQASTTLTDLPAVKNTPQLAGNSSHAKPVITTQAVQAWHQADVIDSPEATLARLQLGSTEHSQYPGGQNRGLTVASASTSQASAGIQPTLQNDVVGNETDLLFASRIQQSAVTQAADLAAQNRIAEIPLNTAQMTPDEAMQSSIARSPLVQTAGTTEALSPTVAQSALMEAVGRSDWGQGMGKQVLWMVNQNISRAEIRLNPANLGPLEVRIEMENDQVNVAFTSRHAEVREAVEQALPRLREMLEEKGLNLSDTDISQHSFAEQQGGALEQDDGNSAVFGSPVPYSDLNDQDADSSHQGMSGPDAGHVLSEGLVDYYI